MLPTSESAARIPRLIGRNMAAGSIVASVFTAVIFEKAELVVWGVLTAAAVEALGEVGAAQTTRQFRMRQMIDERLELQLQNPSKNLPT